MTKRRMEFYESGKERFEEAMDVANLFEQHFAFKCLIELMLSREESKVLDRMMMKMIFTSKPEVQAEVSYPADEKHTPSDDQNELPSESYMTRVDVEVINAV